MYGLNKVLGEAAQKLWLFMGHNLRCEVQNEFIDELYKNILDAPAEKSAIFTLDYKVKYEPKRYRQKSSDWYERKEICGHSSAIRNEVEK